MGTETAVYKFMKEQNRPFALNDICGGVGKEHNKSAIAKSLNKLVNNGKILEKTYNKQSIFCIVQEKVSRGDEELRAMDREINKLSGDLKVVEEKLQEGMVKLKGLEGKMSLEEAKNEQHKLEVEVQSLKEQLDEFKENYSPVSPEEKKKAVLLKENAMKEYRKRKRICTDIIDTIMESYPKTKKNLLEDIGLETDEDVGFVFRE